MKVENDQLHYLKTSDYASWNIFVENSSQTTIYGQTWYLQALNVPFEILVVKEQTNILGGIVLTKNIKGDYGNPYLVKYLGIYYKNFAGHSYHQETIRRKVTNLLLQEVSQLPSFNYFFHPQFTTYLPFYWNGFESRIRYTYCLRLHDQKIDEIKAKFHSKLRSEIKFAEKANYKLDPKISVKDFVAICQQTFRQKAVKFPFSIGFLSNYCQTLIATNKLRLIGVRNQAGQLMAAIGLLITPQTTTLILSGFNREYIQRGANEWLLFQGLVIAKEKSLSFDFEGSMIREIETFYRKFGGDLVPYLQIYKKHFGQMVIEQLKGIYRRLKRWMMNIGQKN